MYTIILIIHSWLRWIALGAGVGATFAAVTWHPAAADVSKVSRVDLWGLFLIIALDVQMLLGLLLYLVVSPNMREILAHFGDAMKDSATRFWAVEHVTAMFAAVIVAHVGRVLARKARTPAAKRNRLIACFSLATILMLVGIPWPGRPGGRPLFRF